MCLIDINIWMPDMDPHRQTTNKNKSNRKFNVKVYSMVKKFEKIRIESLKNRIPYFKSATVHFRNQKWGWAGHVARLSPDRWAYHSTFWTFAFKKKKKKEKRKR